MKIKEKMNRRKFIKLTAAGAAATSAAAILVYSDGMFTGMNSPHNNVRIYPIEAKKVFGEKGACSHTFFYLLNREFGYLKETEESASDPLAGGLMMTQNQCGMLWGSALAAGAESFRMHNDNSRAIAASMKASQHIVRSFSNRAKCVNCREIVGCDMSDNFDVAKLMLKSLPVGFKNFVCMNLAEKWAPEAIKSAKEGLRSKQNDLLHQPISCASEVAKKMGCSKEESVMVAGFAGGLGLSGNACGALAAAIWLNTLAWCREHPGESGYLNPNSKEILNAFYGITDSEIVCNKICGERFNTIDDHTEFIKNGGCNKITDMLAEFG